MINQTVRTIALSKNQVLVLVLGMLTPFSYSEGSQQDVVTDTYTITVSKDEPRLLGVQADLAYAGDLLSMEWESAQFLEAGWATFVRDLEVYDSGGERLETEHILPAKWKIAKSQAPRIHLNYSIDLSHDLIGWEEGGHSESAYVLDDLIFFIGRAVFITAEVLPEEFDDHNYKIAFQIPEDYMVTSQWSDTGKVHTFVVDSTRELVNSAVLLGKQTVREVRLGNTDIIIATGSDFTAAIPVFESIYRDVAPFANRVMGHNPSSKYVAIANIAPKNEKYGPYFSGGVLSRTISLIAPAVPGPEMRGVMEYILTHEYLHLWNTHVPVAEEQLESWFTEGFTDYMAIRILNTLGKLPDDSLLNGERGILGNYQKYLNGRDAKVSLRNAGATKNQGSYDYVYSGGFTFATALDAEFIRSTNGRVSLADFIAQVFHRFSGKREIELADLITVSEEMSGTQLRPMFEEYVLGNSIIALGDYLYRVGLEMSADVSGQSRIEFREDVPDSVSLLREQFLAPDALMKHLPQDSGE